MSRYIDADLIEYESMCRAKGNGMYEDCEIAYKDEIDAMPTADVRENIKGEWIECEGEYRCSNCNRQTNVVYGDVKLLTRYCPNCGADMRGEA